MCVQASFIMKTMIPSLPVPAALGYGAPFPDHTHKAAVVRAPRLGAFAILTSNKLTKIRETKVVRALEAAMRSAWGLVLPGCCCPLLQPQASATAICTK